MSEYDGLIWTFQTDKITIPEDNMTHVTYGQPLTPSQPRLKLEGPCEIFYLVLSIPCHEQNILYRPHS